MVSHAAYRGFNYSMQSMQNNNWPEAQKHVRSADSFLSILYQTGHKKLGKIWFRNQLACIKKNNETQCRKRVIDTMKLLKQANY